MINNIKAINIYTELSKIDGVDIQLIHDSIVITVPSSEKSKIKEIVEKYKYDKLEKHLLIQ